MTAAAAAMAFAAMRPATRIFSMVSASLTSGPVYFAGAGWSTYSGRGMSAGTGRRGETAPGATLAYVNGIRLESRQSAPAKENPEMPYWYNVDTGQVETDDTRSQDANVLGPYDTEDGAAHALADRPREDRAVGRRGP